MDGAYLVNLPLRGFHVAKRSSSSGERLVQLQSPLQVLDGLSMPTAG